MIKFCYFGNYDQNRSVGLLEHAKTFGIAVKYDLSSLADTAADRYTELGQENKLDDTSYGQMDSSGDLLRTIPYIHRSTSEAVRELRMAAVSLERSYIRRVI